LDELLRTHDSARTELSALDTKEPEEIMQHRKVESDRVESDKVLASR
jgi:low affinity Fe/Cu permease